MSHHWTRKQVEAVWDVFSKHDMAFDRESMYHDEGGDSEFCEMHRQMLAETLNLAGLVPTAVDASDTPCNCPCCTGACTQPESKPFRQRTALDA